MYWCIWDTLKNATNVTKIFKVSKISQMKKKIWRPIFWSCLIFFPFSFSNSVQSIKSPTSPGNGEKLLRNRIPIHHLSNLKYICLVHPLVLEWPWQQKQTRLWLDRIDREEAVFFLFAEYWTKMVSDVLLWGSYSIC